MDLQPTSSSSCTAPENVVRTLLRRIAVIAGWAIVTPLALNVAVRVFAHDTFWIGLTAGTFTPYVYLPVYAALAIAVGLRRRRLLLLALGVAVAHLFWTFGPYTRREKPPAARERQLRIVTANVAYWNDETAGIVAELLASDADVIAIQELAPRWAKAFASESFVRAYPHRIEEVREEDGIGLYARVALLDKDIVRTPTTVFARAMVVIGDEPVRVYSVHPPAPARPYLMPDWSRAFEEIFGFVTREKLPVIVAGDFNTTQHSAWYGRMLTAQLRASHDACGRPLATTWPTWGRNYPPIRLDHVFLAPSLACLRVAEGVGEGSDHRPVIVDVRRR